MAGSRRSNSAVLGPTQLGTSPSAVCAIASGRIVFQPGHYVAQGRSFDRSCDSGRPGELCGLCRQLSACKALSRSVTGSLRSGIGFGASFLDAASWRRKDPKPPIAKKLGLRYFSCKPQKRRIVLQAAGQGPPAAGARPQVRQQLPGQVRPKMRRCAIHDRLVDRAAWHRGAEGRSG